MGCGRSRLRDQRYEFGSGDTDADDLSMSLLKLLEIEPQKSGETRLRAIGKILASEVSGELIVGALAVGMKVVPSVMAAQVAVERGADVMQFVKESHHFVIEILIEKPGQTKGQQIQELDVVVKESLNLKNMTALSPLEGAVGTAEGRHPGLQTVKLARRSLDEANENAVWLQVTPFGSAGDNVIQQSADGSGKIERLIVRTGVEPRLTSKRNAV